jgi:hypothetical protein
MPSIEDNKLSAETGFAVIGRAIADAVLQGNSPIYLMGEAAKRRKHELDTIERETQFAALARQIGDALYAGRDTGQLLTRIADLRQRELGPAVKARS